ncbi:MAG TPA: hypothetical protein DCZ93_10985, partial [Elusimicrobia bacterium]|nr:hypothetical protein [Elusimicrobiota bacterium]
MKNLLFFAAFMIFTSPLNATDTGNTIFGDIRNNTTEINIPMPLSPVRTAFFTGAVSLKVWGDGMGATSCTQSQDGKMVACGG